MRASLERVQLERAAEHAELLSLRAELVAKQRELDAVRGSHSWRVTRPLRAIWDFGAGLGSFLNEMRGFPRRARYTIATRGFLDLLSDIKSELALRLGRGTLATPPPPPPAALEAAEVPLAVRDGSTSRPLSLVLPAAPRASIVIPAYGQFDRTYACIASILERTGGASYEVIVVDDGSTDQTRHIEQIVSGIRVVRCGDTVGFLGACNRGAAEARGEFLVFLNNDTFVSRGWLEQLLTPFDGGRGPGEVGIVGAKLVYPDGRLQEAGGIIFADGSGWNYGRGDDPANPKYEFLCDVHYCSGACLAVRREVFEELGGFDRRFSPMYYEDVDLAFQVRATGRRVVYQPSSVIVHFEGGTAGTDIGTGAKRFQQINQQTFAEKWAPALATYHPPESNPDIARYHPGTSHVLVIDQYTPHVDRDAGSVRMQNLCRILCELGCHTTFLPENRAQDGHHTRALQEMGVEAVYHPYLPSLEHYLQTAGDRYDTVIMSRVDLAKAVIDAVKQNCPGAQLVFDTVDLHFVREARRAALGAGTSVARAERLKAQELAVARACDLTLVVSPMEKEMLGREAPDVAVEILSLIMSPDPTDTPFGERDGILFIGNFQHPPNNDAVEYYLRDIHPAVLERLPGVTFTVIGPHVPDSLLRHADETVRFAGQLADIRPAFANARLSVAPLRYGAGIKGKIHSSLALGVPVVTTTIGAEGMHLVDGEDILVADSPEAFAAAVVALHENAVLWDKLARNGVRGVSDQFSFARARDTLARILGLDADEPTNLRGRPPVRPSISHPSGSGVRAR